MTTDPKQVVTAIVSARHERLSLGDVMTELTLYFSCEHMYVGNYKAIRNVKLHGYASSEFSGFSRVCMDSYLPDIGEVEQTLKLMKKIERKISEHYHTFGTNDPVTCAVVASRVVGASKLKYYKIGHKESGLTQISDLPNAMRLAMQELKNAEENAKRGVA